MIAAALGTDPVRIAQAVGAAVAGPAAESVDQDARFPAEAFAALRDERMLGAMVPQELGGRGATFGEIAAVCQELGRHCSSTAMVYAMHQIQVGCLIRHGRTAPFLRDYLTELTAKELLLASATTEQGVGGDVRTSICAIDQQGSRFRLIKQAPVISYGEHADGILATARRSPDAAGNDQVLALLTRRDFKLTETSGWDSLGMRGTMSLGYTLTADAPIEQVLPTPYGEMSSQTMLPFSHILWSSLWLGIATDAVNRGRGFVRSEARKKPGTVPPSALRLAEVVARLQTMRAVVQGGIADFERNMDDVEVLSGLGFALRMNNLKITSSTAAADVVRDTLGVIGLFGYKNDSKYSVGRHLRDAHSAALMIANDRIYSANASMLLIHKDD
ncbi:MAG: acyl-CoA dehydrogenase family protein [Gemmatimonadota bacterium]